MVQRSEEFHSRFELFSEFVHLTTNWQQTTPLEKVLEGEGKARNPL